MVELLNRIKNFIFFDIKWMLIHIITIPFFEVYDFIIDLKKSVMDLEKPKELMRLFLMLTILFTFTNRTKLAILFGALFATAYILFVYYSKSYVNTMRKFNKKKIGVNYEVKPKH